VPKKILLVDDEPEIVKVTAFRLRKAGYEVTTLSSGQEALEYLGRPENKPDLILLDVFMPGLDGYQTCKTIKDNPDLRQIPVVFFTASSGQSRLEQQIKELGATDYVIKPFELEDLLDKISRYIK